MCQVVDKAQSRSHDISIADFVGRLTLLEKKRTLFVSRVCSVFSILDCILSFFIFCMFPLVLALTCARSIRHQENRLQWIWAVANSQNDGAQRVGPRHAAAASETQVGPALRQTQCSFTRHVLCRL
jgi:hypothetical protein